MEAKSVPLALPLFLAAILAISPSISHANSFSDPTNNCIVMPQSGAATGDLRRSSSVSDGINCLGVAGGRSSSLSKGINCLSWRLAVETNNLQKWKVIPSICKSYVANYMTKRQYKFDSIEATEAAYDYAKTVHIAKDGRDVWVFDIGMTALSFLDYYSLPDVQFGAVPYNSTKFAEWSANAIIPPNELVLELYKNLLDLGFKIVFLSASVGDQSDVEGTAEDLRTSGYYTWEKLILRTESEADLTVAEYKAKKRTELENEGYRIRGNLGDQWSDLSHPSPGDRTFKLPNPMFFIP